MACYRDIALLLCKDQLQLESKHVNTKCVGGGRRRGDKMDEEAVCKEK
jgi:hypothetical protein